MQTCSIVDYTNGVAESQSMAVCPRPTPSVTEAVALYGEAKVVCADGSIVTFWNNGTVQIYEKEGVYWTWIAKPSKEEAARTAALIGDVTTFFEDGSALLVTKSGVTWRWPSDAEVAAMGLVEGELLSPNHFHDGWPCYQTKEYCGACDDDIPEFDNDWRELTCHCAYAQ